MGERINSYFFILHSVGILHINFDKATQKFVEVRECRKLIFGHALFVFHILFLIYAVYDMVTKMELIFTDMLLIFNAPFMATIYYFKRNFSDSKHIISAIESLQTFDKLLENHYLVQKANNSNKRWICFMIYLINIDVICYISTILFFICCLFYNSEIKMYVNNLLFLLSPTCMVAYLVVLAYLLMGRSNTLNEIIVKFSLEKWETVCCDKCTHLKSSKHLCKYHQLKLV